MAPSVNARDSMRPHWALITLEGCASTSTASADRASLAGNFGGNTFDTGTVSGASVQLARDGAGNWTGTIGCKFRRGLPTTHVCPFFWEPTVRDGLPAAIGAPGVGGYRIIRSGHSVLLQGTDVEFQFATKVDRDFPIDLIAPLFFAVSMTTDPARDLVSSDPSLGLVEFGNPGTRLVWVISVDGLGRLQRRTSCRHRLRAFAVSVGQLQVALGSHLQPKAAKDL